jgi:DNA-directed RNA polymerase subunit beta
MHWLEGSHPIFNGADENDIMDTLELPLKRDGKSILYDGRTGEALDNRLP